MLGVGNELWLNLAKTYGLQATFHNIHYRAQLLTTAAEASHSRSTHVRVRGVHAVPRRSPLEALVWAGRRRDRSRCWSCSDS